MAETSLAREKPLSHKKSSESTTHTHTHTRDSRGGKGATPTSFLPVFVQQGPAQVCSSAYCSLAWINKEKTGAIRRTCQAWNSLLMFTPFTLGLSQHCWLSLDFWRGPSVICFLAKANKQFQECATQETQLNWLAEGKKFAQGQVL